MKVQQGFVKALLRPLRHSRPPAAQHAGGSSAGELVAGGSSAGELVALALARHARALIQVVP